MVEWALGECNILSASLQDFFVILLFCDTTFINSCYKKMNLAINLATDSATLERAVYLWGYSIY